MPVPRNRASARSIVPSPPSTIAISTSLPATSSTPHRSATARSRSSASSTPSRSIVITAARLTDGIGDPSLEVGWERWSLVVDEVEDELMVSLRARQARVYDASRLGPAREQPLSDLAHDATPYCGVSHDALRRVGAAGFELRLHEHERLPAGRGERQRGRQRDLHGGERDDARSELRREW